MALLHSFGQRLRCATKSLIPKSFTGEVSHEQGYGFCIVSDGGCDVQRDSVVGRCSLGPC